MTFELPMWHLNYLWTTWYCNWPEIMQQFLLQAWDREKSKKEENCYMWGSAATEPPGGGFGRGVPPPAENFAILGTENHVLMQRKIKKRGKLLHVRERSDRTSYPQKILIFFFFFFFRIRISKSAEIRGSAEKSHACSIVWILDFAMGMLFTY